MIDSLAASVPAAPEVLTPVAARSFASDLIARWPAETPLDAQAILDRHPELLQYRSAVLDLAHEEYWQRLEAGEKLVPEEFAERFPQYRSSLAYLIRLHQYLESHVGLGTGLLPPQWPETGTEFLGFRLVEELGRGAFSRVYLATEPALGDRKVVVKVSRRGGCEAHALGALAHRNIVPVFSVQQDQENGFTVICMPFLGRVTLFDLLDIAFAGGHVPEWSSGIAAAIRQASGSEQKPAPSKWQLPRSYVEAVITIGAQVADALAQTHSSGLYHRDIKPSNILLTEEGQPLLFDFNLARKADLLAGPVGGTLPYMPPEQLATIHTPLAENSACGVRGDLFSLGATLYQLLCGELPFGPIAPGAESDQRALAQDLIERQRRGPRSLREANPDVPPALARLIESCLAFDPAARPESAAAFAAALRRQLAPLPRTRQALRVHRRAALRLGIVALAGLAGAIAYWPQPDPFVLQMVNEGWAANHRGEYDQAIQAFSRALESRPDDPAALFGRAWSLVHSGDYTAASYDLLACRKTSSDPRILAYQAYVEGSLKRYSMSLQAAELVIRKNAANAAVYSNAALSCLELYELDKAEQYLREALRLQPDLPAAKYNLAMLDLKRSVEKTGQPPDVQLIEQVLAEYPAADSFIDASLVFAHAARNSRDPVAREAYVTQALDYCERAVDAGLPPTNLRQVVTFYPPLRRNARFRELTMRSPILENSASRSRRLIDPLEGTELPFQM